MKSKQITLYRFAGKPVNTHLGKALSMSLYPERSDCEAEVRTVVINEIVNGSVSATFESERKTTAIPDPDLAALFAKQECLSRMFDFECEAPTIDQIAEAAIKDGFIDRKDQIESVALQYEVFFSSTPELSAEQKQFSDACARCLGGGGLRYSISFDEHGCATLTTRFGFSKGNISRIDHKRVSDSDLEEMLSDIKSNLVADDE